MATPAVDADGLVQFPGAADGQLVAERVEREARVRIEERDPDVRFQMALTKNLELHASLLGLLDQPPPPGGLDDVPVRRVVVYMERGDQPEPLPPGDGPVIDLAAPQP